MKSNITKTVLCLALIGATLVTMQCTAVDPGPVAGSKIKKFSSYAELKGFVIGSTQDRDMLKMPERFWSGAAESGAFAADAPGYSTTNIQVAGVDEADVVKTDGEYIYLVSGNKTIIVKAYPPEQAQIVSQIELEGWVAGLFINADRLVLFEQEMPYYVYYDDVPPIREFYMPYVSPAISIKVYDISDRGNPRLQRELSADGQYVSSRMIGDHVYAVINEPVYEQDDELKLPSIRSDGNDTEVPATDIYYCDIYDYFYMYTTIVAINTRNDSEEPAHETILLGASSNLYVSVNNIYLTFPVWDRDTMWNFEKTSIHRIHIEGDAIEYVASGEVPGMVLNQFSMDEYEGYFRIATTTYGEKTGNHVYILDTNLNVVGSLENLASGEMIYSARFMGDRCYLVTFRQVDPLFVIDLSDPDDPNVLGYLKVTGYSNYLHPYDQNHIIGIGKETTEEGEFAWYQGVKIALFDVSDVSNPVQISKYEIGHRGSESPVLWDHKAFLLNRSRDLLVIPVLEAKVDVTKYSEADLVWAYGEPVWQGAYVFTVSPNAGITLKGRITHIENIPEPGQEYYYYSPFSVERSLYIGDVLYTISQAKIKMNSLENLDYINQVELPLSTWTPPEYLPDESKSEQPFQGAQSEGEELPTG
ncbi:MAG: beta-propeller domain-containing protein [Dehalococcoidia bacterium]